jgi:hypothetical protein
MIRVLRPGGLLLLSNRVDKDAWLFLARMCGRGKLEGHLRRLGLEKITTQRWQEHYDLIWAYKASATDSYVEFLPGGQP